MDFKDLAGVSEPATKLIEVVANAIGVTYAPRRIRKEAEAQAAALIIRTAAEIEADDMRQRAAARFLTQELTKQENIETIVAKSAGLVTAPPDSDRAIDDDWLNRFLLEAQEISDARLQTIWAKLLAGEFQSPGKFPRRVFQAIKDLEPKEADMIDAIAARLLWVEDADGDEIPFLNSHLLEEWKLGNETERRLLGATPVEDVDLLQELGVISHDDFSFAFSVEGSLQPNGIHISSISAKRVFTSSAQIVPEFNQPSFVRQKGPSVTERGVPRINIQTKRILFDAWRVTSLGVALFTLAGKTTDLEHVDEIKRIVVDAGMELKS